MVRTYRAMIRTVSEIGEVASAEGIDCGFAHGGTVVAATRQGHVGRLRKSIELMHRVGFDVCDVRWLETDEAEHRVTPSRLFGALYTPHCAAIDPARLVLLDWRLRRSAAASVSTKTPLGASSRAGCGPRGDGPGLPGDPGGRGLSHPVRQAAAPGDPGVFAHGGDGTVAGCGVGCHRLGGAGDLL